MKESLIFAAIAAALLVVSCGTAKKATNNQQQQQDMSTLGQRKAKSPAQIYAEDEMAETLRAWGRYNGFADQNLESYAAAVARGALAERIAVLATSAVRKYDDSKQISNKNVDGVAETAKVAEFASNSEVTTVAKELIKGSRIAVSDRFVQKDGTEDCYVAVEVNMASLIKAVQENQKFQEALSFDRKAEIDFNSEKFRDSMMDAFEELKQAKQQ
ncbi:MAG: hypothetical protein K6A62_03895 [Bacteroidales bacterium]|nr:hypothetical protein [Bacteroidales bacterium]